VLVLYAIYTKNDKADCNNYRGISLLNIVYKIFSKVLARKLEPFAKEVTGEYQCGFRRNRSIVDHTFKLRMILEKCYEFNMNVHELYIDFKQTYNSVNRKKLYDVLREMQIPAKLITLVKISLKNTKAKVRVQGQFSKEISIGRG
jgi:sorting nexin-29